VRKSIFLGIFLVNIHLLSAQKLVPVDFSFRSIVANSTDSLTNEMLSNVVTEVILQTEQAVWLGTGLGVSVIRDSLTIETLPRSAIWSFGLLITIFYGDRVLLDKKNGQMQRLE